MVTYDALHAAEGAARRRADEATAAIRRGGAAAEHALEALLEDVDGSAQPNRARDDDAWPPDLEATTDNAAALSRAGDARAARATLEDALCWHAVPVAGEAPPGAGGGGAAGDAGLAPCALVTALPVVPVSAVSPARFMGRARTLDGTGPRPRALSELAARLSFASGPAVVVDPVALARAWSQLGRAAFGYGAVSDAVASYEASLALLRAVAGPGGFAPSPTPPPWPERVRAGALVRLSRVREEYAASLRAAGHYRGSLALTARELREDPASTSAWHARAMTLHSMGRHRAACHCARVAEAVAESRAGVLRLRLGPAPLSPSELRAASGGRPHHLAPSDNAPGTSVVDIQRAFEGQVSAARAVRFLRACCLHALGAVSSAYAAYCAVLEPAAGSLTGPSVQGEHLGFCQRDWLLAVARWWDVPRRSVSLDAWTEAELKESFSKRLHSRTVLRGYPRLFARLERRGSGAGGAAPAGDGCGTEGGGAPAVPMDPSPPPGAVSPAIALDRSAPLPAPALPPDLSASETPLPPPLGRLPVPGEDCRADAARAAESLRALRHDDPLAELCGAADRIGAMMQYHEEAFLPSWRQQRQCGLAAIELAQLCRRHWTGVGDAIREGAAAGPAAARRHPETGSLLVPDSSSSSLRSVREALAPLDWMPERLRAAEAPGASGALPLHRWEGCDAPGARPAWPVGEREVAGVSGAELAAAKAGDVGAAAPADEEAEADGVVVGVQSAPALSDDGVFAVMSAGASPTVLTPGGPVTVDWVTGGAAAPASAAASARAGAAMAERGGAAQQRRRPSPAKPKKKGKRGKSGRRAKAAQPAADDASAAEPPSPASGPPSAASVRAPGPAAASVAGSWPEGYHGMAWRDALDVAVQWRQLSEPFDPVFWVDQLTPRAFAEGFGLQTPLVQGQYRVPRYAPYFRRAVAVTRTLVAEQAALPDGERHRALAARSLDSLSSAVGDKIFFVVSACSSYARPPQRPGHPVPAMRAGPRGRIMEGTRLTSTAVPGGEGGLLALMRASRARRAAASRVLASMGVDRTGPGDAGTPLAEFGDADDLAVGTGAGPAPGEPEGWQAEPGPGEGAPPRSAAEATARLLAHGGAAARTGVGASAARQGREFTIRTPGTPRRWAAFEEELSVVWLELSRHMGARAARAASPAPDAAAGVDDGAFAAASALRVFFYWANMGALTRGTAATAQSALLGLSLACGLPLRLPLRGPCSRAQLDWEAILTPDPDAFIARMGPELYPTIDWSALPAEPHRSTLGGDAFWRCPSHRDADRACCERRDVAPAPPTPADTSSGPWFGRWTLVPPSAAEAACDPSAGSAWLDLGALPDVGDVIRTVRDAAAALALPNAAERSSSDPEARPARLARAASARSPRAMSVLGALGGRPGEDACGLQPEEVLDDAEGAGEGAGAAGGVPPQLADCGLADDPSLELRAERGESLASLSERRRRATARRAEALAAAIIRGILRPADGAAGSSAGSPADAAAAPSPEAASAAAAPSPAPSVIEVELD